MNAAGESFVKAYVDYASEVTDAPERFHHVLAYSTLAAVCAHNVYFPFGDRRCYPNLFVALVASSSLLRKTTALNISKHLVQDVNSDLLLPNEFSSEALTAGLASSPRGIFYWSEFASFLSACGKDYMSGSKELLTDLFDCPRLYTRKLRGNSYEIKNPVISIATATTLEWFLKNSKDSDIHGGFLPRFMWVPAETKEKSLPLPPPADQKRRNALKIHLKRLGEIKGEMNFAPEARETYIRWHGKHERDAELVREREMLAPFFSRLSDCAIKLAMLTEISETGQRTITESSLGKALNFIDFLKGTLAKLADEDIAFGSFEIAKKKLKKRLKETANGGISRGDLLRLSHLDARQFDRVMITLVEEGSVTLRAEKTDGRPRKVYRHAAE